MRIESAVAVRAMAGLLMRRRRLAFLLLIRWLPPARRCLILPRAVTLTRLASPLCVFYLGIDPLPL